MEYEQDNLLLWWHDRLSFSHMRTRFSLGVNVAVRKEGGLG
jgi:hypothetical protein